MVGVGAACCGNWCSIICEMVLLAVGVGAGYGGCWL